MKQLGYFLLCAGFISAAYATALDVEAVSWGLFSLSAIAAVAGVFALKRYARSVAQSDAVLETNRTELRESIENVVRDLRDIATSGSLHGAALRDRIDTKLRPDLTRFAEARASMVHLFGLQTYADIMSHFAAGERYINRVWSSSADGYDAEALRYLGRAEQQFADAQRQLNEAARK
ncbi:MAG TPA: hypothetical protein VK854_03520 [Woeseiaceae bacterium]|nr:hypothetical protein [Woeseiaceae bacterium]